jgi:uroporphyrinogen decarboxylase
MPDTSPSFDRVLTALRREEPDRVPLGDIWVDQEVKDAFMGRPVKTLADDVAFWQTAGFDFIALDIDLWATPQIQGNIVRPLGDTAGLYEGNRPDRNWVASDAGVVATWDQARTFPWPKASDLDYTNFEKIDRMLPRGMMVVATFGHIFTAAWQLMGFETFCLTLYEDVGLVREVLTRIGEEVVALLERVVRFDAVGAVCFQDDIAYTSGLIIPPAQLRVLFFPWLKRIADVCHAAGRPLLFHSDGKVDEAIPDVIAAGVDALHPIEPKCMDIASVKRQYGDRLALVGNLDLGYTLTRGTPEEVRRAVKDLIRSVGPGGGFLLSSANSITNYVPLANFKAMLAANSEYGRYPIRL